MMKEVPVKSVKKALDLLAILLFEDIGGRGIELTTLAAKMRMPKNTTHNLLKTMIACDFVAQNKASKYIVGTKCKQIGMLNELKSQRNYNMLSAQIQKLSKDIKENVVYAILAGGRRVSIIHCEPDEQLITIDSAKIDRNRSIYEIPTGKVLTAYASEIELNEIIDYYGEPELKWTDWKKAGQLIRKKGLCMVTPDMPHINSYAVPVLGPAGSLFGAIGCYVPIFRDTKDKQQLIIEQLKQTAKTVRTILT